jgi:hypothetical protein
MCLRLFELLWGKGLGNPILEPSFSCIGNWIFPTQTVKVISAKMNCVKMLIFNQSYFGRGMVVVILVPYARINESKRA